MGSERMWPCGHLPQIVMEVTTLAYRIGLWEARKSPSSVKVRDGPFFIRSPNAGRQYLEADVFWNGSRRCQSDQSLDLRWPIGGPVGGAVLDRTGLLPALSVVQPVGEHLWARPGQAKALAVLKEQP